MERMIKLIAVLAVIPNACIGAVSVTASREYVTRMTLLNPTNENYFVGNQTNKVVASKAYVDDRVSSVSGSVGSKLDMSEYRCPEWKSGDKYMGTGSHPVTYYVSYGGKIYSRTFSSAITTTTPPPNDPLWTEYTRQFTNNYTRTHAEGLGSRASGSNARAEGVMANASGQGSHADGFWTLAEGANSYAGGAFSRSLQSDPMSFTWSGLGIESEVDYPDPSLYYPSHGPGTFNINPVGGLGGFWIGGDNLRSLLESRMDIDLITDRTNIIDAAGNVYETRHSSYIVYNFKGHNFRKPVGAFYRGNITCIDDWRTNPSSYERASCYVSDVPIVSSSSGGQLDLFIGVDSVSTNVFLSYEPSSNGLYRLYAAYQGVVSNNVICRFTRGGDSWECRIEMDSESDEVTNLVGRLALKSDIPDIPSWESLVKERITDGENTIYASGEVRKSSGEYAWVVTMRSDPSREYQMTGSKTYSEYYPSPNERWILLFNGDWVFHIVDLVDGEWMEGSIDYTLGREDATELHFEWPDISVRWQRGSSSVDRLAMISDLTEIEKYNRRIGTPGKWTFWGSQEHIDRVSSLTYRDGNWILTNSDSNTFERPGKEDDLSVDFGFILATRISLNSTLVDGAVNLIDVSCSTNLYLPSVVTNRYRDLIVNLNVSGSGHEVAFVGSDGEEITWTKENPPGVFEDGTNVVRLTEVSHGSFMFQNLPASGGGATSEITDGVNIIDADRNVYVMVGQYTWEFSNSDYTYTQPEFHQGTWYCKANGHDLIAYGEETATELTFYDSFPDDPDHPIEGVTASKIKVADTKTFIGTIVLDSDKDEFLHDYRKSNDLGVRGSPERGGYFIVNGTRLTYSSDGIFPGWTDVDYSFIITTDYELQVYDEFSGPISIGTVSLSDSYDCTLTNSNTGVKYRIAGYVDSLAKTSDMPPATTVVAPSTNAAAGSAADARATGTALYTGFTEWELDRLLQLVWTGVGWEPRDGETSMGSPKGNIDSVSLSWTNGVDAVDDITATRHIVTPTKTSQLVNDGSNGVPFAVVTQIPAPVDISGKLDGEAAYPEWVDAVPYGTIGTIVSWNGRLWRNNTQVMMDEPGVSAAWDEVKFSGLFATKQDALPYLTNAIPYDVITGGPVVSPSDPTFSNAVLSVGLNIDTNTVAAINALVESGDDLPIGGATTVGAILLAIAAAIAVLKRRVDDKASVDDLPYELVEPGKWEFSGLPPGTPYAKLSYTGNGKWELGLYDTSDTSGSPIELYADITGDENALKIVYDTSYEIITATRVSLPGHLLDRAVNKVELGSDVSSYTLTFPSVPENGRARDFFVRLIIQGSTPPTISFVEADGVTPVAFDADDDSWADIEPGVNILMFTDTAR